MEGEPYFKIGHANAAKYINADVEFFIKGLHHLELIYREKTKSEFGFGSPSPTAKVINALEKINQNLALELRKWIRENGGNYYIPKR
jgi:hypothetical protein